MGASNFNLRNIPDSVMFLLKKEAAKEKVSVNSLILLSIQLRLGVTHQNRRPRFHDLDDLAGTWSEVDQKEFDANRKSLDGIDEELWR